MVKDILPYLKSGRLFLLKELFAFFGHTLTLYITHCPSKCWKGQKLGPGRTGFKSHLCCFLAYVLQGSVLSQYPIWVTAWASRAMLNYRPSASGFLGLGEKENHLHKSRKLVIILYVSAFFSSLLSLGKDGDCWSFEKKKLFQLTNLFGSFRLYILSAIMS